MFGTVKRFTSDILCLRFLLWFELCSSKKYISVLAPSISECDIIWKLGHCMLS